MNQILRHAEVDTAAEQPFTPDMAAKSQGFNGGYDNSKFTDDDIKALRMLREHFRKDQEDLKALVDMLYPHLNFTVQLESDP